MPEIWPLLEKYVAAKKELADTTGAARKIDNA
jgi:hypothetical protein